jgi:hypothetical protein
MNEGMGLLFSHSLHTFVVSYFSEHDVVIVLSWHNELYLQLLTTIQRVYEMRVVAAFYAAFAP